MRYKKAVGKSVNIGNGQNVLLRCDRSFES